MDGVLPSVDDIQPDYLMAKTGIYQETRAEFLRKASAARETLRGALRGANNLRHPRAVAATTTGQATSSQGLVYGRREGASS